MVQSVERAFELLDIIARSHPVGVSKLSRISGLSKTTVVRLVGTLNHIGMVDRDQNRNLVLGLKAFDLGSRALATFDLRHQARPFLDNFSQENGMSLLLGILNQEEVIYIDKVTSIEAFQITATVGSRAPAYCTASGKILMSFLSIEKQIKILSQSRLVKHTSKTENDPDKLMQLLSESKERGFSIEIGEWKEELCSVSAPITGPQGEIQAAVSCPRMAGTIDKNGLFELGNKIKELGQRISQAISG